MSDIDIQIHKSIRTAIKLGDLVTVSKALCEDRSRFNWNVRPFGSWLHIAAANGQLRIVEWLIEQGMNVNQMAGVSESGPLDEAASNGHLETVRCLINHGATLDTSNSVGNPLFGAIHGGHADVAKLLIESGIDTAVKYTGENMTNMDALAFAKEWGRSEIVALLEARSK